ncbi:hypothetical protein HELRODRAFT_165387 [Helobdella robusta]|uniref:Endonuclease/exonuclease/phosphatase domain-containing protein n=1 Tax=Helobdella robusta TaxID=6412 RepID=T1EWP7_HELRO|nr:hypothetical protein HELRODRAFT_165387 [Helobdella robusta]ESN91361.1 hypothetical protein HELRODRAFT_165387 [Helobdella robusta]
MATHFKKDRSGRRRGGGVVIYLKSSISSQIHIVSPHAINDALKTLCLKCFIDSEPYFICAIYHPPNHPSYEVSTLMGYIDELSNTALGSGSKLIIVGDFNQLDHHSILQKGLHPIFLGPTHQGFQTFYALKILLPHGLRGFKLFDITESLLISNIKYAALPWSGFATQLQQLQSLIKKLIRFDYLPASYLTVTQIFNTLDSKITTTTSSIFFYHQLKLQHTTFVNANITINSPPNLHIRKRPSSQDTLKHIHIQ